MLDRVFLNMAFLTQNADMPPGSILKFDENLLIQAAVQWFNIMLLTVLMIFILYKPVKKFMADRAGKIQNDIESARRNNQDAQELKAHYKELIGNIEKEREEILNQAHKLAVEKSDQILFAAHEEAKYLMTKAKNDIEVERENAADDIKRQIIELSTFMASRFIEVSVDRHTQDKYVDEAMLDWSDYTWQV